MDYKVKNLKNSSVEIKITFDEKEGNKYRDAAIEILKGEVDIKGFRAGKAPNDKVIEKVGDAAILQRTIDVALQKALYEIVGKESLKIIGTPQVDLKSASPIETVVTVDIVPELIAIDLKKIKVKKEKVEVTKKDIDESIENILNNNASWDIIERKAKKGDRVEIDFKGYIDDKAFEGGEAKKHHLVLGDNTFIPGFEDQLIGVKAGDDTKVTVKFPEDYLREEFQGKEAVFEVTVHSVAEKTLPELTDELVEKITDKRFKKADDLKVEIEKVLLDQKKMENDKKIESEIVEQLIKHNKIVFPESIINDELKYIMNSFQKDLETRNMDMERYLKIRNIDEKQLIEDMKKEAENRVKVRFNLKAIADANNIEISVKEIEDFTKGQEAPKDANEEQVKAYVEYEISLKKAYDLVYKTALGL